MAKITRTLIATRVTYSEAIIKDGVPTFLPPTDEILPGQMSSDAAAIQHLRKYHGENRNFVVTARVDVSGQYELDAADFLKHATRVGDVDSKKPTAYDGGDDEAGSAPEQTGGLMFEGKSALETDDPEDEGGEDDDFGFPEPHSFGPGTYASEPIEE